jgi:DNA topoisomerase-3
LPDPTFGTPATRAEIIRRLKTQDFLIASGKHIVPTERGLSLFAVLEQADPALVDPGVTAQMERLLDDVLIGQQELIGAIDAVCAQASRIIGRLQSGVTSGNAALLGGTTKGETADRPPTPAMKRFVDSVGRQQGLQPGRGYATSSAICRAFLNQHAPKRKVAQAMIEGNPSTSGRRREKSDAAAETKGPTTRTRQDRSGYPASWLVLQPEPEAWLVVKAAARKARFSSHRHVF